MLVSSNAHEYFEPTLALLLQLVVLEGSYTDAYMSKRASNYGPAAKADEIM